jgi:hypothetical protein
MQVLKEKHLYLASNGGEYFDGDTVEYLIQTSLNYYCSFTHRMRTKITQSSFFNVGYRVGRRS